MYSHVHTMVRMSSLFLFMLDRPESSASIRYACKMGPLAFDIMSIVVYSPYVVKLTALKYWVSGILSRLFLYITGLGARATYAFAICYFLHYFNSFPFPFSKECCVRFLPFYLPCSYWIMEWFSCSFWYFSKKEDILFSCLLRNSTDVQLVSVEYYMTWSCINILLNSFSLNLMICFYSFWCSFLHDISSSIPLNVIQVVS
jgi:hypothetical protein